MDNKNNKNTLSHQIQIIFNDEIQKLPHPVKCTIKKIYEDNFHVDITTETGVLKYVETIGNNLQVGNLGVLIFLNNNFDDYIVLTK